MADQAAITLGQMSMIYLKDLPIYSVHNGELIVVFDYELMLWTCLLL